MIKWFPVLTHWYLLWGHSSSFLGSRGSVAATKSNVVNGPNGLPILSSDPKKALGIHVHDIPQLCLPRLSVTFFLLGKTIETSWWRLLTKKWLQINSISSLCGLSILTSEPEFLHWIHVHWWMSHCAKIWDRSRTVENCAVLFVQGVQTRRTTHLEIKVCNKFPNGQSCISATQSKTVHWPHCQCVKNTVKKGMKTDKLDVTDKKFGAWSTTGWVEKVKQIKKISMCFLCRVIQRLPEVMLLLPELQRLSDFSCIAGCFPKLKLLGPWMLSTYGWAFSICVIKISGNKTQTFFREICGMLQEGQVPFSAGLPGHTNCVSMDFHSFWSKSARERERERREMKQKHFAQDHNWPGRFSVTRGCMFDVFETRPKTNHWEKPHRGLLVAWRLKKVLLQEGTVAQIHQKFPPLHHAPI